jgi:hypothetical protein
MIAAALATSSARDMVLVVPMPLAWVHVMGYV